MKTTQIFRIAFVLAAVLSFAGAALAQTGPYSFNTVTPCRVVDTRNGGTNGGPALGQQETRNFQIRGLCGIPMTAKAVSFNLAAVTPSAQSHLILWASGTTKPGVSAINFSAADFALANGGIVGLSTSTQDLSVFNAFGTVHVIIDVNGYYQ
jgi:hypothetical protein